MPRPYPQEFRDDVVAVARRREGGVTLAQIAKDFGISESCLTNWLHAADVAAGVTPGATVEQGHREPRAA
jgi:transposase-like protein